MRVPTAQSSGAMDNVQLTRSAPPMAFDSRMLSAPPAMQPGSVTVYEQYTSSSGDQTTTRVVTYVVNNAAPYSLVSPRSASHLPHAPFLPSLPAPYPFTHSASAVPSLSVPPSFHPTSTSSHSLRHVSSQPSLSVLDEAGQHSSLSVPTSASRPAPLLSPSEESALIEEHHLFSPSPNASQTPANRWSVLLPSPSSAGSSLSPATPSPASGSHATEESGGRNVQSLHRRRPGSSVETDQAQHDGHDGSNSSVYSSDDGEDARGSLTDTPSVATRHLRRSSDLVQSFTVQLRSSLSSAHTAFRRWEKALFDTYLPVLSPSSPLRAQSLPLAFVVLVLLLAMAWWMGWLLSLQSVEVALPIRPQSAGSSHAASLLWGGSSLSSPRGNTTLPVHVIAACVNRWTALRTALPTWLAVREVSSVTVVDWGSEDPLHERLMNELEDNDGRLRIVRLTQKREWMLPTAVNLALHFIPLDSPSLLLKVDCDTLLHPDFVRKHRVSPQRFYAGDFRKARDENEVHLNGVLFVRTQDLLAVNGYDERLQSYGYDDTNLHDRLRAANLTSQSLRYQYIQHLQHDDSVRRAGTPKRSGAVQSSPLSIAAFNSPALVSLDQLMDLAPPFFELQLHRILLKAVPQWNTSMSGATFHVQPSGQSHVYEATLRWLPTRLEDMIGQTAWLAAVRKAAEVTLRRAGVQVEKLARPDRAAAIVHYLMRLVAFWSTDSERPALVVHVQHGLSNRLRGLASAAATAAALHMPLKVIWLPDHHCTARFSQLFRLRNEVDNSTSLDATTSRTTISRVRVEHVWEDTALLPAVHALTSDKYDIYNYMEPEPQAEKDKPIVRDKGKSKEWRGIYVKSAYRLQHPSGLDDRKLHVQLQSLLLSEPVLALLDSVQQPAVSRGPNGTSIDAGSIRVPALESLIGVHIRHRPPGSEIADIKAEEYPPAGWATLEHARQQSSVEAYTAVVQAAINKNLQQRFYISSDSADIVTQLEQKFGPERITYFAKDECPDRSVRCTQLALVEQLMLAQTGRLIGSVWSSFSEIAALWRLRPIEYPAEVRQAVDEKLAQAQKAVKRVRAPTGDRPFFLSSDLLTAPFNDTRIADFIVPADARATTCRIEVFSILGERCSGTNYLQQLLEGNFDTRNTDDYHYRHFFGFEQPEFPYKKAECVLFVGVVRAPVAWLDCFYKYQWQLDQWLYSDWYQFLTQPIQSYRESEMNYTLSLLPEEQRATARDEMLTHALFHDRNFADPQLSVWKDVFELRQVKALHMMGKFKSMVDKYVMVRLEDLQTHYQHFLHILQLWFNLQPKSTADLQWLTEESPMPDYTNAEMDKDVAEDMLPLHGTEHVHVSPWLHEFIWQHLDREVEQQLGYREETD